MSTSAAPRPPRLGRIVLIVSVMGLAVAACSGPPGNADASGSPVVAMASPAASASPIATLASAPASAAPVASDTPAPSGGPVDYSAWVERQGFGGSSGLKQLLNDVNFLQTDAYTATLFDVEDGAKLADHLAGWLDQNPPTACWTDYHAAMRIALGKVQDDFAPIHDNVAAGHSIPADIATRLVKDAQAAFDMAAPAGC